MKKLELDELLNFIKMENARMEKYYKIKNPEQGILGRTVKLSEEVGELSAEVLHSMSLQRKEKAASNKENLSEEVADVLFTTLFIADKFDVDVRAAIQKKIAKINKRYE